MERDGGQEHLAKPGNTAALFPPKICSQLCWTREKKPRDSGYAWREARPTTCLLEPKENSGRQGRQQGNAEDPQKLMACPNFPNGTIPRSGLFICHAHTDGLQAPLMQRVRSLKEEGQLKNTKTHAVRFFLRPLKKSFLTMAGVSPAAAASSAPVVPANRREIGGQAVWSLSSCKQGKRERERAGMRG
jgi:hypothetical protein